MGRGCDDQARSLRMKPGHRVMIGVFCAWTASGPSGCAANSQSASSAAREGAEKHYEIAVGSFHNGMFDDARIQLDRALASDPEHADSYYLLGLLHLQRGKTMVDAIEIERCLTDEAAEQQRRRAQDLHRKAHDAFGQAAKYYDAEDPGRGRAYNSMAVVSLFFLDHDQAIQEAEQALESRFYTERYSALANLGWAYYGQGELVEAMTELRQSVLLNPDYCVGRYRLAQVYLDYELPKQALEAGEQVADNENCPIQDAHRIVGVARIRLGQGDAARDSFQTCVALAPRSCLAEDCRGFLSGADAQTLAP